MLSIKADIANGGLFSYKIGIDRYTQNCFQPFWLPMACLNKCGKKGMMSDNTQQFRYMSHDFMYEHEP